MKSVTNDLLGLFYPKICLTCAKVLIKYEEILCFSCRTELPLTNFSEFKENEVERTFYGRIQVEAGTSLLHYSKKGIVQKLIHQLKYKKQQQIGAFLAELLGDEMMQYSRFNTVDCIIPVPLHPKKLKSRGYNQVTLFGQILSQKLNIPYFDDILKGKVSLKTQTHKSRFDRLKHLEDNFELTNKELLKNRHILLIDDVVTTGATLEACCIQLNQVKNIKISIATMAITD